MERPIKNKKLHALVIFLLISIIVYFILRAVSMGFAEYGLKEKTLGILFFLAEAYVMFHALGYFHGIYTLTRKNAPAEVKPHELKTSPSVAILIPSRHEPSDVLENTALCCYNLSYPSKTIYLLDDSSEEKYKKETEMIAKKYDCQLFQRQDRHGAKAGVINDCLKQLKQKYIAIFDVDQNPIEGFLEQVISILEDDPELAFIQTPQYYSNLEASKVSLAANMQQTAFYEYICESKSVSGAMMCCGTNTIIRRKALEDVGGFDETTVTEDFATSFQLHLKGWKTLYYNHVNTFGQGPENISTYLGQQNRWSMGNVSVLKKVLAKLIISPSALKPAQWWEYLITGSYYMVSWAYMFLVFCPILFIFSGVPSFFMHPAVYLASFLPYIILAYYIYYSTMKSRGYSFSRAYKGQLLLFLSLPTYIRGTFLALCGIKKGFKITSKQTAHTVPYTALWPQVLVWAVSLAAITWGVNRFIYSLSPAVAVNVIWITYHFLLMSSLFYFNEEG